MTDFRNLRIGGALHVAGSIGGFATGRPGPHRRQWIIRPDDLLVIDISFEGMKVVPGQGGTKAELVADGPGPRYLVLTFPPQHLAETAFFTTVDGYAMTPPDAKETQPEDDDATTAAEQPGEIPIDVRLAGWSTLVFIVRDEQLPVDWTLEALLPVLTHLELSVAPTALPPSDPPKPVRGVPREGPRNIRDGAQRHRNGAGVDRDGWHPWHDRNVAGRRAARSRRRRCDGSTRRLRSRGGPQPDPHPDHRPCSRTFDRLRRRYARSPRRGPRRHRFTRAGPVPARAATADRPRDRARAAPPADPVAKPPRGVVPRHECRPFGGLRPHRAVAHAARRSPRDR